MERIHLNAAGPGSSVTPVLLEILEGDEVEIRMQLPEGEWRSYPGSNFFKCLMNARIDLEEDGLLLCCQGARADVFPSGMQQQMDRGRFATVLTRSGDPREVVDIFGAVEPSQATTVEAQRVAVFRFFGLKDPGV